MKRIIQIPILFALFCGLLALVGKPADAQTVFPVANDISMLVYAPAGSTTRYIDTDKTGRLQFLMYGQDPTTGVYQMRPQTRTFDTSIICGASAKSECSVNSSSISIYSAQLLDSTATGRALLTAVDAAAARLAIGAGTSTFDGAYSGLTGVPSTFTPAAHTHAAADIVSGTLAAAHIPALPISQTTGLQTALDGKQAALALTTTGSGAATLTGAALNIPTAPAVPTINRVRATTAADGTYSWTLPIACASGTTPVVSITPESSTAGDAISHRVTAISNTTVSVFAGRSAGLTVLSLTVLGVPAGAAIPLHLIAICP